MLALEGVLEPTSKFALKVSELDDAVAGAVVDSC
jgi:hypothetical protein